MKRTKKTGGRIPADPKRCQVEKTSYHPFQLGPPRQTSRCASKPVFIIHELEPDKDDGLKGSMSICTECFVVFYDKFRKNLDKFDVKLVKP